MQAVEFEGFFKENYSKIYCYAHSLVRDDEAARDIVADSFEYLFTHNPHLSKSEASNYLFAIVRNRCADFFRKQAVHQRYSEYITYTTDKAMSAEWSDHDEKVEAIRRMMGSLTPRTREILEAHYLQGKKYSEVASELGISESAVKKHIMQALRMYRENVIRE